MLQAGGMSLSVHFVNGPADGLDHVYSYLTRPLPSLYIADVDDRWRAVYRLVEGRPLVYGRWQYCAVRDRR